MKNKVKYSVFSRMMTALVLVLCVAGLVSLWHRTEDAVMFAVVFGAVILSGLYYCPVSVEADASAVKLHRLLSRPKVFAYKDIQTVDTCYPSAGGIRLCGSGGCFGYWGYFNDIMMGTYFGYYGSHSHCFLIKLKNGRQYVVGCDNPVAMVSYIKSQMEQLSD